MVGRRGRTEVGGQRTERREGGKRDTNLQMGAEWREFRYRKLTWPCIYIFCFCEHILIIPEYGLRTNCIILSSSTNNIYSSGLFFS